MALITLTLGPAAVLGAVFELFQGPAPAQSSVVVAVDSSLDHTLGQRCHDAKCC